MYLSLHSYSQMWLTPWGNTANPPEDVEDLVNTACSLLPLKIFHSYATINCNYIQ